MGTDTKVVLDWSMLLPLPIWGLIISLILEWLPGKTTFISAPNNISDSEVFITARSVKIMIYF